MRRSRRGQLHAAVTDAAVDPNVHLQVLNRRLACRKRNTAE